MAAASASRSDRRVTRVLLFRPCSYGTYGGPASVGYCARSLERRAAADYRSRRFSRSGGGLVKGFGALWRIAGRRRTRSARFAPALAVVAALAAVVQRPQVRSRSTINGRACRLHGERERSATPSGALRVPGRHRGNAVRGPAHRPRKLRALRPIHRPQRRAAAGHVLLGGRFAQRNSGAVRELEVLGARTGPPCTRRRSRLVHLRGSGRRRVRDHRPPGGRRHDGGRRAGNGRSSYDLSLSAQTTSGPNQLSLPPGCAPGESASGSCPSHGPSCKVSSPLGSG